MRLLWPFIMPVVAFFGVAVAVVALGMIFLGLGQTGTIIAGLIIIILTPLVGLFLSKRRPTAD